MDRVMTAKEKGRRTFLKLATAGSLTAAGVLRPTVTHAQHSVPNSAGTEAPRTKAPANAADCHIHIYDAQFKSAVPALPGRPSAMVTAAPTESEAAVACSDGSAPVASSTRVE